MAVDSYPQCNLCPSKEESDHITAEEIFNIKLDKPPIILLMGCNTGRTKISEVDDLPRADGSISLCWC
jgi:hypothetical protein